MVYRPGAQALRRRKLPVCRTGGVLPHLRGDRDAGRRLLPRTEKVGRGHPPGCGIPAFDQPEFLLDTLQPCRRLHQMEGDGHRLRLHAAQPLLGRQGRKAAVTLFLRHQGARPGDGIRIRREHPRGGAELRRLQKKVPRVYGRSEKTRRIRKQAAELLPRHQPFLRSVGIDGRKGQRTVP